VTGAGGFVGANLVRRLVAEGAPVVAAVRPGADAWRLDGVGAEVRELDLEDLGALRRAVAAIRPRIVFNLAAHGAYSWQTDLERMLRVNVLATAALREAAAAAGVERIVHAGSSSEYGFQDHPADELDALAPNSDYAATKAAATHLLAQSAPPGPLTCVLRLYSVYGPWEEPGRLIPTLVAAAARGMLPPLADPAISRDFVYVEDAVDALLAAASRPLAHSTVINVSTGAQTTLAELVAVARDLFGVRAEPVWGTMAPRAWDTSVWSGRPDRARALLGWEAATSLAAGLERTAEWLRADEERAARYG